MRAQLAIHWPIDELWSEAPREDSIGAELADGHYSRQTVGADGFLASGRCLVLVAANRRAVWGVVFGIFREVWRWRNSIFRNDKSGVLSSLLIERATSLTYRRWREKYGALPSVPLRTEVDIEATRARRSKKSEPGKCYLEAGWTKVRDIPAGHGRSAKVELEAPEAS